MNSAHVVFLSMMGLAVAHPTLAKASSYDDYTVIGTDNQSCAACSIASAGDVDGDAQGDLMVRVSDTDPATYIVTAATLAGGKTIELIKADFLINTQNRNDLQGNTLQPAGDVDQDGQEDLFISTGDVYEAGTNDDRLISSAQLETYRNTGQVIASDTTEESNSILATTKAPAESVTVGVGLSKDISCALNPRAISHSGWLMLLCAAGMAFGPMACARWLRRCGCPQSARRHMSKF